MTIKPFILAALTALLWSCADSPSVQFYVLEPLPAPTQTNLEINNRQVIGIGPISLPSILENKKIVTRLSDNTVQIAQFQQWASPLQDNILLTLTRNLTALQPNTIIRAYPWSVHGQVDQQIIIDIVRFDTTPGLSANLEANWTIKNEKTNAVLQNGRSVINQPLTDPSYPATVHALSKILGSFSQELLLALLKSSIKIIR